MADGIRVTAVDLKDGDTGERTIAPGDYCLVVAEPLYLAGEQRHANGTVVLTLKRRSNEPRGRCAMTGVQPGEEYPEVLLAHDDRCNAPAGGGCTCREWERFDLDNARPDDGPCDCSEALCAGFDNCRDEASDG